MPESGREWCSRGMTNTAAIPVQTPELSRGDVLAYRLLDSAVGAAELLTVQLGHRLGLYSALFDAGPVTASEFAAVAGIAERYAREWLDQQAAAGILDVVHAPDPTAERCFLLPGEHVPVLVDPESPLNMTGAALLLGAIARAVPEVTEAFRSGEGVAFDRYGRDLREGIGALNRPGFTHGLAQWLSALPDIERELKGGGAILDAGCGEGWSTIALARQFPEALVVGVDLDPASITAAIRHAREAGVSDRVRFAAVNASSEMSLKALSPRGYDLVTVFEALHDMGSPVRALDAFRSVLNPHGAVLLAEERVADEFTPAASELERLFYALSVLHCVPATMAESRSIAHGTVLRPRTLAGWARDAGFREFEELPIPHDFWRFYRLG